MHVPFSWKICVCLDSNGREDASTRRLVMGTTTVPSCENQLFMPQPPKSSTTTTTTKTTTTKTTTTTTTKPTTTPPAVTTTENLTTLDDHGFSEEDLKIKSGANYLPACEADIQFYGKKPFCDENGDFYPVQCNPNTQNSYWTQCYCVDIKTGAMRYGTYHNVETEIVKAATPHKGETNLNHGQHCRPQFNSLQQREEQKAQAEYGHEAQNSQVILSHKTKFGI